MAGALLTTFFVIPEIGENRMFETPLAPKPGYDALKRLIEPHLDGERMEHVAVLWEGERRDMFVGECSAINGRMIRNVRATVIYRNNALTRDPALDPESLPAISGPAVVFPHRRVWF